MDKRDKKKRGNNPEGHNQYTKKRNQQAQADGRSSGHPQQSKAQDQAPCKG